MQPSYIHIIIIMSLSENRGPRYSLYIPLYSHHIHRCCLFLLIVNYIPLPHSHHNPILFPFSPYIPIIYYEHIFQVFFYIKSMAGWWFGTWILWLSISWECHHHNWLSLHPWFPKKVPAENPADVPGSGMPPGWRGPTPTRWAADRPLATTSMLKWWFSWGKTWHCFNPQKIKVEWEFAFLIFLFFWGCFNVDWLWLFAVLRSAMNGIPIIQPV